MRGSSGGKGRGVPESLIFLVGHPVSHSLSPAMHNGVIARRNLPLRYVAYDLSPGALPDFFRFIRSGNFLGGNVTIPYKEEAAALAENVSEAVRVCGAANVICVRSGRLHADNTDGRGLLAALDGANWGSRFARVVLLGAGGAARGIGYELARAGTREMVILNRTPSRAHDVAELLARRFPRLKVLSGKLEPGRMAREFSGADLVVQCTSLGLTSDWETFPVKALKKETRFVDIVYQMGGTALVKALRRRGVPAMDGLPMLAHQAALSFTAWTGMKVPGEEFLAFARRGLARKDAGKGIRP
ncbi:MAG TPA: shikimate dehydrogenase [Candidatus Deferrimicrobiaceae bacterium]|nr:shikimate dehydrogenase [Candidatus Deferrimicrobiaceae bacterium]